MSIDIARIRQQSVAKDRQLEGSVNSTLRNTTASLQQKAQNSNEHIKKQEQLQTQTLAKEKAEQFAKQMESISAMFDRKLQFKVNEDLQKVVVKVIDGNTDTVIREIPSAEIQKLQLRIKEALGLLFDEKR